MFEHIKSDKIFNFSKFEKYTKRNRKDYCNKYPFPYDVLHNFFSDNALEELVNCFPSISEKSKWDVRNDLGIQVKYRSNWKNEMDIPDSALLIIQALQSGRFCRMLSNFTGIPGLMPDYWFGGGGFNLILPGGELAMHIDGTMNDEIQMYRRINIILFLNKNWEKSYGGYLELWDKEKEICVQKIKPEFNSLVIFNTDHKSKHGHPYPLSCPKNISRKSLILYYYTSDMPEYDINHGKVHRAIFNSREDLGI